MGEESPRAKGRLLELAAATPATRDRYVDFLRAASILVVVLGHWLIAIIYWRNGEVVGQNALDVIPVLWLATWILQVMPVFFFVGGFSNLVTIDATRRRGGGYTEFIHGRVERLMRPTLIFLLVWIPVTIAVDILTRVDDRVLNLGTGLLTRPLWFIGIYMIMIAAAPPMASLHRRYGFKIPAILVLGAAAVDLLAVGMEIPVVGYLNFAFVWLFVHQLGFFYADGRLQRSSRSVFWMLAICGLLVLAALTASGIYSPSMVGLRNERSNTNPPTIAIIALTVWQLGLVMLLRDRITRWLSGVRVWAGVIFLNLVIMTLFLWHQTAMLAAVGILYPLGFPQPEAGTAPWWALRPLWVLSLAALLALFVLVLGRYERVSPREPAPADAGRSEAARSAMAVVGVTFVLLGILGFAVSGFDGFALPKGDDLVIFSVNPLQNLIHLVLGMGMLRLAARGSKAVLGAAIPAAFVFVSVSVLVAVLRAVSPEFNFLAGNSATSVLHLVAAAVLAGAALRGRRLP